MKKQNQTKNDEAGRNLMNKPMFTGHYMHDTVLTDAEKMMEVSDLVWDTIKKWTKKNRKPR